MAEIRLSAPAGQQFVTPENKMWIMHLGYNLNPEYTGIGYVFRLKQLPKIESCKDDEFLCFSRDRCLPLEQVCNGHAQCDDYSDERSCGFCGEENIFLSGSDSVISFNTSSIFKTSQAKDCIWFIGINDTYRRIKLNFKDFSFGPSNTFTIGSGLDPRNVSTKILKRNGEAMYKTLLTEGSFVWIATKIEDPSSRASFDLAVESFVEEVCDETDFKCPSGLGCVNQSAVCNGGLLECPDREDERGCGICPAGTFKCLTNVYCYTPEQACDGHPTCPDSADELNCVPCESGDILLANNVSHHLMSPQYPNFFTRTLHCLWLITTKTSNIVALYFDDIWLEKAAFHMGPTSALKPPQPSLHYVLEETTIAPTSVVYHTQSIFILIANTPIYQGVESPKRFSVHLNQNYEKGMCDFQCDYSMAEICISEMVRCKGVALCPAGDDQENCGDCGVSNILFRDFTDYNLTSSGYPFNYPNDLSCNWIANAQNHQLVLEILDFDLERGYDYLTIGTGDIPSDFGSRVASLTGVVKLKVLTFQDGILWTVFKTDSTGSRTGFAIQLLQNIEEISSEELCVGVGLVCGNGFCVHPSARCDGFNDCLDNTDESHCETISCPGSYPCQRISLAEPGKCVVIDAVCDGIVDCPLGDDEQQCDVTQNMKLLGITLERDLIWSTQVNSMISRASR
ncbi:CUB and sushi domain-containing protein 3-like [Amphiura filiformis]|uniref:CUB and sushi domain-containing protein 3-like n=1 Tax=Amphiura filiformis TaxID=82378 RepID=UPI003B21AB8A